MDSSDLKNKYNLLCEKLNISHSDRYDISTSIRNLLRYFMIGHKRVAIYCNGYHTKMLMTDYVADLKNVVCIVDNGMESSSKGLRIIKDYELELNQIDGVIISSFKYKEPIKTSLKRDHNGIDVLDIYDALKNEGIYLNTEFYSTGPYRIYKDINAINTAINNEQGNMISNLRQLLNCYVSIKDFRMSLKIVRAIYDISKAVEDMTLIEMLKDIYSNQLFAIKNSDKNNVLMLCLDGMRYIDFAGESMKKTREAIKKKGMIFTNAYSYSTMTFESLIPSFSENTDQRTKYYDRDEVQWTDCRFCRRAIEQERKLYIYGDGYNYIAGNNIRHTGFPQTVTEKLWDFTIDICEEKNGLFYLHELYESHYSFPNPYTSNNLIANGTALLFDFLPKNGGKLQTDYLSQLRDSLRYIDDTLAPFVTELPCSVLFFADHGNMIMGVDAEIETVEKTQLCAAEEWLRIPMAMISSLTCHTGEDNTLISLIDLNDMVISLLDNKKYIPIKKRKYIKFGRSAIYNPDFKELYRMINKGYNGEAFEGFVFNDGLKIIVYSDGNKELYTTNDNRIYDEDELVRRYNMVSGDVSIL